MQELRVFLAKKCNKVLQKSNMLEINMLSVDNLVKVLKMSDLFVSA